MEQREKEIIIEHVKKVDLTESMGILYEMEYIEEKTRRKLNKIRKEKIESANLRVKEIKEKIEIYEVLKNKEEIEIIETLFIEEKEMEKKKVIIHTRKMGFLMIEEGKEGHFSLEQINNGEWAKIFVDQDIIEKKEEVNLIKEIVRLGRKKTKRN